MGQQEKRYVTHFFTTGRSLNGSWYKRISFITTFGEDDKEDKKYFEKFSRTKEKTFSRQEIKKMVEEKILTLLPSPVEINYGERLYIANDNGYILMTNKSPRNFFAVNCMEDYKIGEVPIDEKNRTY